MGSNDIVVNVKACGLSTVCDKILDELFKKSPCLVRPVGYEISGIVTEIGSHVTSLCVGDEVLGMLPLDSNCPGCADVCICSEYDVVKKPSDITFQEAAATVGDAVKAYTALHYLGHLTSGDTVLILNGASSFSTISIQMAQQWGAKVLTTVSSKDEKLVIDSFSKSLAQVIDMSEKRTSLVTCIMEETGGIGADIIVDDGVTLFSNLDDLGITQEMTSFPVPSKHDVISSLGVGGKWITTESSLQLDPPDSQQLYAKCAGLNFLFPHSWLLSGAQQGRYQHMLHDIVNKLIKKDLTPNVFKTVSLDNAASEVEHLDLVRLGKVVVVM